MLNDLSKPASLLAGPRSARFWTPVVSLVKIPGEMAKRRGPAPEEPTRPPRTERNALYYGDNLDVLRTHIEPESVDLIYLDPPFQSGRNYNVIYGGESQEQAFTDTWQWDSAAAAAYDEVVRSGQPVGLALEAFLRFLGHGQMLAYQSMMAVRLLELHKVLKSTGSLYLHCDPTASHYLKIVLDAIFGMQNYRNELIWKRSSAHSGSRKYSPVHDTLLFYTKTDQYTWNPQFVPEGSESLEKWYVHEDKRGRYKRGDLTGAGVRGGASGEPWHGFNPTAKGRHWAVPREIVGRLVPDPRALSPQQALDLLYADDRIITPKKTGGQPMLKRYLHEAKGVPATDVIVDIPPLSLSTTERVGYPTQKPLDLLTRIIRASTNDGDLVLDPFCGCGTTVEAAHDLGRRWIGIDITHLAIRTIKRRLALEPDSFTVIGEPTDLAGAQELAGHDPFQFQQWALGLIGALPPDGTPKKGKDRGVDGVLHFQDGTGTAIRRIAVSVKSGKPKVSELRDLHGVVTRDQAAGGVMVSLEPPTRDMRTEAAAAGFYLTTHGKYPVLQIVTIDDLLHGKRVNAPPLVHGKIRRTVSKQLEMSLSLVAGAPTNVVPVVDGATDRKGPRASVSSASAASEKGEHKGRK